MGFYNVWNGDTRIDLLPKELSVLKIYKGSENVEDLSNIGFDISKYKVPSVYSNIFNNKGINYLNMLLENPSYELSKKIKTFEFVRIVLDEIKTLIDVSCLYGLNEGPQSKTIYRYENNDNLKEQSGLFNSFKSYSNYEGGIKHFKNENTSLVETFLIGCFPHMYMESIPFGLIEGESEILLPPYIKYMIDKDMSSYEDEEMYRMNICCVPEKETEEDIEYEEAIQLLEKIKVIDDEQTFNSIQPVLKTIGNHLRNYAFRKYNIFNKECKIKYENSSKAYLMNNSLLFEKSNNNGKVQVTLNKGKYYSKDGVYYITFEYPSFESKKYINGLFNKLVLQYGAGSYWARMHRTCIMPYIVDGVGNNTSEFNKDCSIGGTNIPDAILTSLLKSLVEKHKCVIKCNDYKIEDIFDEETLNAMVKSLSINDIKKY